LGALQLISGRNAERIMEHSIRRRLRTVLTCQDPHGWHARPSRFALGSKSAGTVGCIVDFTGGAAESTLPHPGETMGVTFRMGRKKCMFSGVLRSIQQGSDGTLVTLTWPTHLEQLQRRAYDRVAPPKDCVVAVRFWLEDLPSAASGERNIRHGQLEDLSAGGMRISASGLSQVEIGATYKCVFAPRSGAAPLVIDATLRRHETIDEGRASLGFHFIGFETTQEGIHSLDRIAQIVNGYQRFASRGGHRTNTASK
jgi:c-di-GMP-binding flagellar brake protein YcgR